MARHSEWDQRAPGSLAVGEDPEERSDLEVILEGVAEGEVRMDLISVSAADLLVGQVARLLEFGHDPLGGSLGDPDLCCDLAHQDIRVLLDAQQDVRVVGQEGP